MRQTLCHRKKLLLQFVKGKGFLEVGTRSLAALITFRFNTRLIVMSGNQSVLSRTVDYLRMDGKRGHVTCGNRLAIERQESFQKFASLQEELLLPSAQACWDPTRFRTPDNP